MEKVTTTKWKYLPAFSAQIRVHKVSFCREVPLTQGVRGNNFSTMWDTHIINPATNLPLIGTHTNLNYTCDWTKFHAKCNLRKH